MDVDLYNFVLLMNRVLVYFRLKKFVVVEFDCNLVVVLNRSYIKVYFR